MARAPDARGRAADRRPRPAPRLRRAGPRSVEAAIDRLGPVDGRIYGWRARLGYVGCAPLEIATRELLRMAPEGVIPVATNIHLDGFGEADWTAALREYAGAAEELDTFEVQVVVVDAAPHVYRRGIGADRELAGALAPHARVPILPDISAAVDALRHLRAERIAVASPFDARLTEALRAFLGASGFEVARLTSAPHRSVGELRRRPSSIARDTAARSLGGASGIDALFIDGADWAVAPHIQPLEDEFGVPVVGLTQAACWAALRRLDIHEPVLGFGRLLAADGG